MVNQRLLSGVDKWVVRVLRAVQVGVTALIRHRAARLGFLLGGYG